VVHGSGLALVQDKNSTLGSVSVEVAVWRIIADLILMGMCVSDMFISQNSVDWNSPTAPSRAPLDSEPKVSVHLGHSEYMW
jgi:hypothetical protein